MNEDDERGRDEYETREDWFGGRIVRGLKHTGNDFIHDPIGTANRQLRNLLRKRVGEAGDFLGDILKGLGINPKYLKYIIYAMIILAIIGSLVYIKSNLSNKQPQVIMMSPPQQAY
jgi:hypothetical protein